MVPDMSAVLFEQPYIELVNSYGTEKITELEAFVMVFFQFITCSATYLEVLGTLPRLI